MCADFSDHDLDGAISLSFRCLTVRKRIPGGEVYTEVSFGSYDDLNMVTAVVRQQLASGRRCVLKNVVQREYTFAQRKAIQDAIAMASPTGSGLISHLVRPDGKKEILDVYFMAGVHPRLALFSLGDQRPTAEIYMIGDQNKDFDFLNSVCICDSLAKECGQDGRKAFDDWIGIKGFLKEFGIEISLEPMSTLRHDLGHYHP